MVPRSSKEGRSTRGNENDINAAEIAITRALEVCIEKSDLLVLQSQIQVQKYHGKVNSSSSSNSISQDCIISAFTELTTRTAVDNLDKLSVDQQKLIRQDEILSSLVTKACELEFQGRIKEAVAQYEICAAKNCTISTAALGRIFLHGQGVTPNPTIGVNWLKKCVENGASNTYKIIANGWDPSVLAAHGELGQAYRHGLGLTRDENLAEIHLRLGQEGGDVVATNNLGSFLAEINRIDESAKMYQIAAEKGYHLAMMNYSNCLRLGQGVEKNTDLAKFYLEKAVRTNSKAFPMLARLLIDDMGQDISEVLVVLRGLSEFEKSTAGTAVDSENLRCLSQILFLAQTQEDDKLSLDELRQSLGSCQLNETELSSLTLKSMDSNGLSLMKDNLLQIWAKHRPLTSKEVEATKLLREASITGNLNAALDVGVWYLEKLMFQDALEMLKPLAKKDNPDACYYLGLLFTTKDMPMYDVRTGLKYYSKAQRLGHPKAAEIIESLQNFSTNGQPLSDAFEEDDAKIGDADLNPIANKTLTEEEAKAVQQFKAVSKLIRDCRVTSHVSNHFKAGSVLDHIEAMESYMSNHQNSFSGSKMLYSFKALNEFFEIVIVRPECEEEMLLKLLKCYLLTEKVVQVPYMVNEKTSAVTVGYPFNYVFEVITMESCISK